MNESTKLFADVEALNTEFRRKVRQLVIENVHDGCSLQSIRISLEVVTSEVLDDELAEAYKLRKQRGI